MPGEISRSYYSSDVSGRPYRRMSNERLEALSHEYGARQSIALDAGDELEAAKWRDKGFAIVQEFMHRLFEPEKGEH